MSSGFLTNKSWIKFGERESERGCKNLILGFGFEKKPNIMAKGQTCGRRELGSRGKKKIEEMDEE